MAAGPSWDWRLWAWPHRSGFLAAARSCSCCWPPAFFAGAFHVFLDRPLAAERARCDTGAKAVLKELRWQGHDEEAVRALIAIEAGPNWDLLFERLFGHRAMTAAHARWRQGKGSRLRRPLRGFPPLVFPRSRKAPGRARPPAFQALASRGGGTAGGPRDKPIDGPAQGYPDRQGDDRDRGPVER